MNRTTHTTCTTDLLEELESLSAPDASAPETPEAPADEREPVSRFRRRALRATLAALAVAGAVAGSALASQAVSIAGANVAINPKTKAVAIAVTCTSETDPCKGVLDVRTAARIKPYRTQPAAVAKVGTFPFEIPGGQTSLVKGRVLGPALAQALNTGQVRVVVVARLGGSPAPVATRTVLLTLKGR